MFNVGPDRPRRRAEPTAERTTDHPPAPPMHPVAVPSVATAVAAPRPASPVIRRVTGTAAAAAQAQGAWLWWDSGQGLRRVRVTGLDDQTATVTIDTGGEGQANLADLSQAPVSLPALAGWIAATLVSREVLEGQLGLRYVRSEVRWAMANALVLPDVGVDIVAYVTGAAPSASATTSDVIGPVREGLRLARDRRHVAWLDQQRQVFDRQLQARRLDARGATLRGHADVTDPHYTALDQAIGMPNMLWRFTSNPRTEVISIAEGTDFAKIVRLVAGHTGGNKKDDGSVRTLSFGRNLAALMGVAHSTGGDANVAAICARAEYLYGVSLDSLRGQGITAHPAEARMIGIFETEYVLVGSPGAPPRRLEDLATVKYANPFKTPDGGQVPDLPVKPLAPGKRIAIDPPAPDLRVAPEGFRAAVIEYARKVSKAATSQAFVVQDKEGMSDAASIDRAVKAFVAAINSARPADIPPPRSGGTGRTGVTVTTPSRQPVPTNNGPVVGRTLPSRTAQRSLKPATGPVPSTDAGKGEGKPDGDQ